MNFHFFFYIYLLQNLYSIPNTTQCNEYKVVANPFVVYHFNGNHVATREYGVPGSTGDYLVLYVGFRGEEGWSDLVHEQRMCCIIHSVTTTKTLQQGLESIANHDKHKHNAEMEGDK